MARLFLSEDFVSKYRDLKPNFGPLGWVTYKRTYARWQEELGRTEEWFETVKRVIEGNFNIIQDKYTWNDPMLMQAVIAEMEEAYDLMFNFCWLPPGRGLWQSGTAYAEAHGDSLYNCWQISTKPHVLDLKDPTAQPDPTAAFRFMLDISMKGGGVGFNAQKRNVSQFPAIKGKVDLCLTCREDHPDIEALKALGVLPVKHKQAEEGEVKRGFNEQTEQHYLIYGTEDAKHGWGEALKHLLESHWNGDVQSLNIDISDVRENGAKVKTFGGTSAGPKPLVEMLIEINAILNERVGQHLSTVDAVDLENLVGKCVVSGGMRRTAQIAGSDIDANEFITMKQDQAKLMSHRWCSNNSVIVEDPDQLTDEVLHHVAEAIKVNGEPGIVHLWNTRNYGRMVDGLKIGVDGRVEFVNPCGEVGLENFEACNLVEIFPSIIKKLGKSLKRVAEIATRYAKRVTFVKLDWARSQEVMDRNRRLGVSLSGLQDWALMEDDVQGKLDELYHVVYDEDVRFSKWLGCEPSIKLTAEKPSGSISLLPGVAPGMHWHYAKFYIRRMTFQDTDPLLPLLASKGFRIEKSAYSENAFVVEFPVKAATADLPGFKTAGEVSLREQLEFQKMLQWYWADNLVSCTATFKEEEREEIEPLLREFLPQLKGTSLLPYKDHGYVQAPYQPIDEEEYLARLAEISEWPTSFEDTGKGLDMVDQSTCEGGSCPIR